MSFPFEVLSFAIGAGAGVAAGFAFFTFGRGRVGVEVLRRKEAEHQLSVIRRACLVEKDRLLGEAEQLQKELAARSQELAKSERSRTLVEAARKEDLERAKSYFKVTELPSIKTLGQLIAWMDHHEEFSFWFRNDGSLRDFYRALTPPGKPLLRPEQTPLDVRSYHEERLRPFMPIISAPGQHTRAELAQAQQRKRALDIAFWSIYGMEPPRRSGGSPLELDKENALSGRGERRKEIYDRCYRAFYPDGSTSSSAADEEIETIPDAVTSGGTAIGSAPASS